MKLTLSSLRLRRRVRRLAIAVPVAVAFLVGGSTTPAQANLLDELLSGPGSIVGPVVGQVSSVACNNLGSLPSYQQGFCVLRSAQLKYRTTYVRPDGSELVRTVNGVALITSYLNADDDLLPEASAFLTPISTDTFTLQVDRSPLEPGAMPIRFEVIAATPSGIPGAPEGRDFIYAGFDARGGRLPTRWSATIKLVETSETRTTLGFQVDHVGPATKLMTIGGMFDGTPAQRLNPLAVTVDPQPVPATLAAVVSLGEDANGATDTGIQVAASAPTKIAATFTDAQGTEQDDVTAYVDSVGPNPISVVLEQPTAEEKWVRYRAAERINAVRFQSESRSAGVLLGRVRVELDDVAPAITFHQAQPGVGEVEAEEGLGQVRVAVNDRHFPAFPSVDGPHFSYLYDGVLGEESVPAVTPPSALDIRLDRLEHASFDTRAGLEIDLKTGAPPAGQPRPDLRGYVEDRSRVVDAKLTQFPSSVHVLATPEGQVHYDGRGQSIPRIDASILALQGTLSETSRYTRADATILDLPPVVDVSISPDRNRIAADAGEGVGSLRVHARDAASSCAADLADDRGAVVIDTPANACLAARFDGLKSADVQVEPLKIEVKANQKQDLVLRATMDEAGDSVPTAGHLDGAITQAPEEFRFQVAPGAVTPTATTEQYLVRAGDRTPRLTLTGTNLPTSFGKRYLDFDIEDLPERVDVELPTEGEFNRFELDAPGGIGRASLELAKNNTPCLSAITAEAGVAFTDTALAECIGARINGVKHVELQLEPLQIVAETEAAQVFQIAALIDDVTDAVSGPGQIAARITKLPREVAILGTTGTIPQAADSSTLDLELNLSTTITELTYSGTNLPEAFPARYMELDVEQISDQTRIRVPKDGNVKRFSIDTFLTPIRRAEVHLTDDGQPVELDTAKDSVAVVEEEISVLVHDIKRARFVSQVADHERYAGTPDVEIVHTEDPRPLYVHVDVEETDLTVEIADPPTQMGFSRSGNVSLTGYSPNQPDVMRLSSSDAIPNLLFTLVGPNESRVELDVSDIPAELDVCLWSGGGTDHQVEYSVPSATDPTWCYQPEKKPFDQGGDPFALFDTVQFTLSSPGTLDVPIRLNKMVLKSKDSTGTSKTTVTNGSTGEVEFAFGSGFIWSVGGTEAELEALYGSVYDGTTVSDNEGLHVRLDTDHHGLAAKLVYEFDPAGPDEVETTTLTSLKTLQATDKITVLDMSGVPSEDFQRGSIGECSIDPLKWGLTLSSGVHIIAETLSDYFNCTRETP